jgi:hypothetical protein
MRFLKISLTVLVCFVSFIPGICQKKNYTKSYWTRWEHNYRAPTATGHKARIICPGAKKSEYPYHAFGVKLGDPFAFSYKFYPGKRLAFVADFGKASSGLYSRYFRQKFDQYSTSPEGDTLSTGSKLTYSSHKVKADIIGELKMLYRVNAKKISPGLEFYGGVGWEWKRTTLDYGYFFDGTSSSGKPINEFQIVRKNRSTMGPQAVAGIEYAYFKIPLSAFMEIEYFTDVTLDPGWQRFEGGVGLRYMFR